MNSVEALDELTRAADAAGYAMASIDDETYASVKPSGDEVARGARVPTVQAVLAALPPTSPKTYVKSADSRFIPSAHSVRDTVYGYLGLGATA